VLAAVLDAAARDAGDLARRLAVGWPDDHGREWTERLQTLRTSFERDAEAAARVAVQAEQLAEGPAGPRLGGTGARRADDERGVRIPRWDDRADDRASD
jgi:hypothetical protein